MTLLGLDLGRRTGFAVVDGSGEWRVGSRHLEGDTRGDVFLAFRRFLGVALEGVDCVAYEEVRFNRGFSYIPGQMALLQAECARREIAYVGVGASELKKWATGAGNASKGEMVEAARAYVPELLDDDEDEADAVLVAAWALDNALRPEAA